MYPQMDPSTESNGYQVSLAKTITIDTCEFHPRLELHSLGLVQHLRLEITILIERETFTDLIKCTFTKSNAQNVFVNHLLSSQHFKHMSMINTG